ncbi:MAG: hypothetical protein HRU15_08185 [Planctomycetes bacterium]|nr:hypothetical protein [Planctomycetota bacterium]
MSNNIQLTDEPAPEAGTAAYGALYEAIMDAHLLGLQVAIPTSEHESLENWLQEILSNAEGALRGVAVAGIPKEWLPILRWAGVPISLEGPLIWGTDIVTADVKSPKVENDTLVLPSIESLSKLTSLGMRPVRHFIGSAFGIRLQAANSISCYLWSNQTVLISRTQVLAGGFLHGPNPGQRASLAIEPGTVQLLSWTDE